MWHMLCSLPTHLSHYWVHEDVLHLGVGHGLGLALLHLLLTALTWK